MVRSKLFELATGIFQAHALALKLVKSQGPYDSRRVLVDCDSRTGVSRLLFRVGRVADSPGTISGTKVVAVSETEAGRPQSGRPAREKD